MPVQIKEALRNIALESSPGCAHAGGRAPRLASRPRMASAMSMQFISPRGDGMGRLKVLSVGLSELATLVRDALLLRAHSKLAVASNYWDLCSLSLQREEFQVAVLNDPNSARELRRRAKYIRRTWPDAVILLVGCGSEVLAHPLYDERVPSRIEPADLLTVIDRLNPGVAVSPEHRARLRCQR